MTFTIVNIANNFDPINGKGFATQAEAEIAARDLLATQPAAVVQLAQVLKVFRASVTVTEEEPEASPALPGGE